MLNYRFIFNKLVLFLTQYVMNFNFPGFILFKCRHLNAHLVIYNYDAFTVR